MSESRKQSDSSKPASVTKRRTQARFDKLIEAGEAELADLYAGYARYIRWFRVLKGCDPDTNDVSNDWHDEEEE